MRLTKRASVGVALFGALLLLATSAGAQQQRTSENDEMMKRRLERFPESDINKDGVLTMEEAREHQKKAQPNQQQRNAGRPKASPPTHADVKYGPHEKQALDFYQAESDTPTPLLVYIHGGGFRGGDKQGGNPAIRVPAMEAGVSVASINYRLTDVGPYPMQMHDSARALQFLRSKAKEWNFDPKRVAATGGSAGAGISMWLAFHDDLADLKSKDPIARQSTRLVCAVPMNGQCTYDPRAIKEIVPGDAYNHPALFPLFGRPEGWNWDEDKIDKELDALLKDCAPITHLTKDDVPIFAVHNAKSDTPGNIHHGNFGRHLKQKMDEIGIESIHHMDKDFENADAINAEILKFLKKHFNLETAVERGE